MRAENPPARIDVWARLFSTGADPGRLWLGPSQREALAGLKAAVLRREPLLVLTGDVGTGKTILAAALLGDLGDAAGATIRPYPGLKPADFRAMIAEAWGLEAGDGGRPPFIVQLTRFLSQVSGSRAALIVIDEAQSLTADLLAEIEAMLTIGRGDGHDRAGPLSVLLVGQDDLGPRLSEFQGGRLLRRVRVSLRLRPLSEDEVAEYVRHQLKVTGAERPVFTADALREIAAVSRGIPRLINTRCNLLLWQGARQSVDVIDAPLVRASSEERPGPPCGAARESVVQASAHSETETPWSLPLEDSTRRWVALVAVLALLLFATGGYLYSGTRAGARRSETPPSRQSSPAVSSQTPGLSSGPSPAAIDSGVGTIPVQERSDIPLPAPPASPPLAARPAAQPPKPATLATGERAASRATAAPEEAGRRTPGTAAADAEAGDDPGAIIDWLLEERSRRQ
jgi:general secretion pathway protein A